MVRRKILYGILLYIVVVYNVLYGTYDGYVLLLLTAALPAAALLILVLQRCFVKADFGQNFRCEQRLDEYCTNIRIKNPTPFPVTSGTIHLRENGKKEKLGFRVRARSGAVIVRREKQMHCGVHRVLADKIYLYDYFRIFRLKIRSLGAVKVIILPRFFEISEEQNPDSPADEDENGTPDRAGDDYSEIFDIRAYRDGDRLKSIHQKLSCRMNRLMIKEYAAFQEDNALFAMRFTAGDTEKKLDENDLLLESMYAVMSFWLQEKGAVRGVLFEEGSPVVQQADSEEKLNLYFMNLLDCKDGEKKNKNAVEAAGDDFGMLLQYKAEQLHIFGASVTEEELETGMAAEASGIKIRWYIPKQEEREETKKPPMMDTVCVSRKGDGQICLKQTGFRHISINS